MNVAADCELLGRWRIVEADLGDRDYLDLIEPAYMSFAKNGRGVFAFGGVNATMELDYGQRIVFFKWTGFDEGDEIRRLRLSGTRKRYHRNRAVLPQWRRCDPKSAPRMTSSTAC